MSPRAVPLRLDPSVCDGCGQCVQRCKSRALKVGPGYILVGWESCDGCGVCAEACGRGAIVLKAAAVRAVPVPAGKPAVVAAKSGKKAATPSEDKAPSKAGAVAGGVEWSLPEAFLALLTAFALYVGTQSIPGAMAHAPIFAGATLLLYNAALTGLLYFLARRRSTPVSSAFRLGATPEWRYLGLAAALAVGCWLVSVGYRAGAPLVGFQPPIAEGPELATLFGPGAVGAVLTMAVVAVVGPLVEEALLRGVVLGALRRRFGAWPAIAVSALAFALLHASAWSLLPLTVLGVALGWLAVRSRSLWPAIAAHVLYNVVFVGAALYKAAG